MRKKPFMVACVIVSSFTLCVGLTAASNSPQNKAGAAAFAATDDAATGIALAGSASGPGGF